MAKRIRETRISDMKEITVEELEKIESDQSIIVDIRPNEQFLRGTFPGAVISRWMNGQKRKKN